MTITEATTRAWDKYREENGVLPEEVDVWEKRAFEYAYKTARLEERGAIIGKIARSEGAAKGGPNYHGK